MKSSKTKKSHFAALGLDLGHRLSEPDLCHLQAMLSHRGLVLQHLHVGCKGERRRNSAGEASFKGKAASAGMEFILQGITCSVLAGKQT